MPIPGLKPSRMQSHNSPSFQASRKIRTIGRQRRVTALNDYPHNLVLNYSYELPFGPGKKFAKAGGVRGNILGGWKIAGIQQYQSGAPNIISNPSAPQFNPLWPYQGANRYASRPDVVLGVPQKAVAVLSGHYDPNRDSFINPAAFTDPAPSTFGNAPRISGELRGFAYLNEDISIIKTTRVNERVSVEFRTDFLNIFNRTVFGLGTGGDQYGSALATNGLWSPSQSNYPREIQFGLKINY